MIIPKRFKLAEAVGSGVDAVRVDGTRLIAVDTAFVAIVPILASSARTGADLPRLEETESKPDGLVATKAIAVCTNGKNGHGRLLVGETSSEVNAGEGKPWARYENPTDQFPAIDPTLSELAKEPPKTHRYVTVNLDAEALVRLSRAIGAQAEGVRLKFLINESSGRCDASGEAHGAIEVRPVRESDAGFGVLMAVIIS